MKLHSDIGYWPLSEEIAKILNQDINVIYNTIPTDFKDAQESDRINIWTTMIVINNIKCIKEQMSELKLVIPNIQNLEECVKKGEEYLVSFGIDMSKAFYDKETCEIVAMQTEGGFWVFSQELCQLLRRDVSETYA